MTIAALYYWPLSLPENSDHDLVGEMPLIDAGPLKIAVGLFALSASLRPSNVLLSFPLVVLLMRRITKNINSAGTALESAFALLVVGRVCLVVGCVGTGVVCESQDCVFTICPLCSLLTITYLTFIDSLYYGQWTFTPLAFLKRNVLESISIFYGQSPVHFYLSSALPFVCFTTLPYTLHGLLASLRQHRVDGFDSTTRRWYGSKGESDPIGLKTMTEVFLFFLAAMSLLSHKEVRFLQPIVPVLHILEGYALSSLPSMQTLLGMHAGSAVAEQEAIELRRVVQSDRRARVGLLDALTAHVSPQRRRQILAPLPRLGARLKQAFGEVVRRHGKVGLALLGVHLLPIIYLSFHSAGQVAVAETVGRLSRQGRLDQIGFLMPCHSTPWMSHMHSKALSQAKNGWFITCEPPLDG